MIGIDTTNATTGFTFSDNLDNPYIGLVKLGPNTLVLSGSNFYLAGTTVSAGTLEAKYPVSLPGYNVHVPDFPSNVTVASGAMLAVNVGGSNEWNSGGDDIGSLLNNNVAFSSSSSLGIDTTDATAAFILSDNISGVQGLAKLGPNTLILTGTNTYSRRDDRQRRHPRGAVHLCAEPLRSRGRRPGRRVGSPCGRRRRV